MRAWQVVRQGEPVDVLRLVTLDGPPQPGPGQVRIRVAAAGIGLPDVLMCRGTYPLTPDLPFTPGQEVAGTVTAVGPGVEVPLGSRVMAVTAFTEGHGSFAEECLALAGSVLPVPDGLDDDAAAGFWIPYLTAWVGLVDRGRVAAGEWLAVLGAAGGSGIAAVQLGAALGARVLAVVGDDARAEYCRSLGAEATFDHRTGPLAPALRELTGGHGVDAVYDPVGGAPAADAATALARGGRHLAVGFASGTWPQIPAHQLVIANTSLVGVFAGGYSRAELESVHGELSALVGVGKVRSAVTGTVPFDELPAGLQRVADRGVVGKLVLGGT
ncbi:NADPH:quinone oxidoreductase family protein [Streptomycetaceae bacterium NBC_01309]